MLNTSRVRMQLAAALSFAVVAIGAWLAAPSAATWADMPFSELEECGTPEFRFIGFSDALNKLAFPPFAISEMSGIAYDSTSGNYVAVADRAGATATHVFDIAIPIVEGELGTPAVTAATVLKQPDGMPFNGFSFDGEGIAIGAGGVRWVASEGGSAFGEQPEIVAFAADGTNIGSLEVPAMFHIGPTNLAFESLAISPSGRSLFTVTEAPLAADGRTDDLRSRVRILRYEDRGEEGFKPVAQYFYLTEPGRTAGDLGVAELIALSETDLLVLERGFIPEEGNTIRVFLASLRDGQDVSGETSLVSPHLEPVTKEMAFDLADCPPSGAVIPPGAVQPNPLLDNFEAMALGPVLPGGHRALILVSDDNGNANQTTRVIALAVQIPGLVGQDWNQ